jgi:hypothetical protein
MGIIWDHQIELPCIRHDSGNPHPPPAAPRPVTAPVTAPAAGAGAPITGDGRAAGAGAC